MMKACHDHAEKTGIAMPKVKPNRRGERVDGRRALRLRIKQRLSWTDIGKKLECTTGSARRAADREAKRRGVTAPPHQRYVPVDQKQAIEFRHSGMTWLAIAVRLGCSPSGARQAYLRAQR